MRWLRRMRVSVSRSVAGYALASVGIGALGGVMLGNFATGWSGGAAYAAGDDEGVGRYGALAGNARDGAGAGDGSLFDAAYDASAGPRYGEPVDCRGCGPTLEERRARAMGYDAQVAGYDRSGGYDPDAEARRVTAYLARIDAEEAAARRRDVHVRRPEYADAEEGVVTVSSPVRVVRTLATTVTTSDDGAGVEP